MMRTLLLLIAMVVIGVGCDNVDKHVDAHATESTEPAKTPEADASQLTTIQWIDSVKNLGKINEGQKVEVVFRFKNAGDKPLVIQSVTPGCGCTVADYPKEPIAPGKEAEITGSFDSKGREGLQTKEITVRANTKNSEYHTLRFQVEVAKTKS